jgi:hypothetical protein
VVILCGLGTVLVNGYILWFGNSLSVVILCVFRSVLVSGYNLLFGSSVGQWL